MESITMIHVVDSTNLLLKIGWLDEAIMCFEKLSIYFSHFAFTLFDELCTAAWFLVFIKKWFFDFRRTSGENMKLVCHLHFW